MPDTRLACILVAAARKISAATSRCSRPACRGSGFVRPTRERSPSVRPSARRPMGGRGGGAGGSRRHGWRRRQRRQRRSSGDGRYGGRGGAGGQAGGAGTGGRGGAGGESGTGGGGSGGTGGTGGACASVTTLAACDARIRLPRRVRGSGDVRLRDSRLLRAFRALRGRRSRALHARRGDLRHRAAVLRTALRPQLHRHLLRGLRARDRVHAGAVATGSERRSRAPLTFALGSRTLISLLTETPPRFEAARVLSLVLRSSCSQSSRASSPRLPEKVLR